MPTLIFFNSSRFIPIPIIINPPIAVIWFITVSFKSGFNNEDEIVIEPWYNKTIIEENITPKPRDDAKIIETTPSSRDLTYKVL